MIESKYNNVDINTPYYVLDECALISNLKLLRRVMDESGCKILLAQKCFSMYSVYPLISKYLSGVTASGLYEARLGHEEMTGENHVFCPVYLDSEIDEVVNICDHIVFNSFNQFYKHKYKVLLGGKSIGLRVNPECSTQVGHEIYDPCASGSRLGIKRELFEGKCLDGVEGIHFHTLCEQNSDDLVTTLIAFESKFEDILPLMKWVNFGGGHHITRSDYDVDLLISAIKDFKQKYNVEVYLEPGEAVVLNAGYLVGTIHDIVHNDMDIAIVDTSAACHMPDVLEVPYKPVIIGGADAGEKAHTYRFGGATCLAGDIIGDYSFDSRLEIGDKFVLCDMALYTMVKNNTFNGMPLPSIVIEHVDGSMELVKEFSYNDFKSRLS